jgi:hypothetical protein
VTPTKRTTAKRTTAKRTTKRTTATKRTATKATPDKLRAVETFVADVHGDPMIVHAGEVVSATHAFVKDHEALFEPADVPVDHE